MAERTAVLTPLAFALSAGSFRGVLEATQEDMRAGVFTMDLLLSLSCVASLKLQTNKVMCYMGNVTQEALQKRKDQLTARWFCGWKGRKAWMLRLPSLQALEGLYWPPASCFCVSQLLYCWGLGWSGRREWLSAEKNTNRSWLSHHSWIRGCCVLS